MGNKVGNKVGIFIMYTNIEREGWNKTLCTPNKQTLEYMIKQILNYEERVDVIIKYKTDKCDYPLISFNNKINKKNLDISKMYKLMPR